MDSFDRLQRLEFLDVSDNVIDTLPPKFGDLKWLRVARLARNRVVDLRPCVGLTGCEELDVSENQITQVPDNITGMTSLVTLNLSHNGLAYLPPVICLVSRRRPRRDCSELRGENKEALKRVFFKD